MQSYYDSRQSSGSTQEVTSDSSNTAAFRNAFRSAEEYPGGDPGSDGSDGQGAYAWATGADGKDGETGETGQDGYGQDGTNGTGGGSGGGLTIDISKVPCGALESKLKSCGISTGGKDKPGDATCSSGTFNNGLSICDILEQQAKELGKLRKELDELKDKVKDIEKQLKDTVDC
jgi:hypothetical protein